MGIKGDFYNSVRDVQSSVKLNTLTGVHGHAVCGLDISIWLHKVGKAADPASYVLRQEYKAAIDVVLWRLRRLHGHGLKVISIFDGAASPYKSAEDGSRAAKRAAALAELQALEARRVELLARPVQGEKVSEAAMRKAAQGAWRRTPAFEAALKAALDDIGFFHQTAPFEADSQLALMARSGQVEYVLSEDADLVALGCPLVLRNVDIGEGTATLIRSATLISARISLLPAALSAAAKIASRRRSQWQRSLSPVGVASARRWSVIRTRSPQG